MPRSVRRFHQASAAGRHRSPNRDRNNAWPGRSPASRTPMLWCSPANSHEEYSAPADCDLPTSRWARIGSSEPPLQFGVEVLGFFQERRNRGGDLRSDLVIVSMARAGAHFAKASPSRPVAPQQALSVAGPDQIGKRHPLDFVGGSRDYLEVPTEHPVAELIGELESLYRPVAKLLVRRLALATGKALAKAP